ncbi:hypothetical protein AMTRI_Chr02g266390 [Amborella trichopoda]|uniref:J domain-containing protein n=1 Tax=Amborella trichopoda TaxID=13333 RepID=W1P4V9_AMBTC|nr:dnaJ homolog subfamily B member 6 [Amborella trichopoda]ERN02000.1 hypothetical protein AMTR_s00045p00088640 [Amborella trichopoda]|eukprot:XP_006840325.1 dnaJ homolog subfamily B member 6 [Amborella trichopoda]
MLAAVAKEILGFPPDSHPTPSQVKAAYKRKALETHPDRFSIPEKNQAESRFKQIAEAYSRLRSGTISEGPTPSYYTRVVRTGVPKSSGRSNTFLIKAPFLLLILGTISLGGFNASKAYQRQKEAYPSHNPFLP